MIITHPDILVSPTVISSSVRCLRQAALGEVNTLIPREGVGVGAVSL